MATALIHFTQGAHTDTAGKAVLGVAGDFSAVTVTNGSNTGVVSWKIYLLDAPPDSTTFPVASQPQILAQAVSNTPTVAFTPDVAGTYRLMLEVTDGAASVDRDIRCFGIPDARGFVRPPFQQNPEPLPVALPGIITLDPRPTKPDEQNYGSNQRGWAGNGNVGQIDQFLRQYDDLPQKVVTTTPYTVALTDPPLHKVNVTGSPVLNLPNAPRVGFVVRVICIGDPVAVTPQGGSANIGSFPNDVLQTTEGALYVYQGSNTWQVLSRELSRARRGVSVFDYLTGSNTLVAAINAALADASVPEVYFPPGVYPIDSALTSNVDGKVLWFQPGAILQMAANGLGSLTINGVGGQIQGVPTVRFDVTSAVSYVAVDLHGANSSCEQIRFVVNANVANCTLIRLSGEYSTLGPQSYSGTGGSFKYGVELSKQDGNQVRTARSGLMSWEMLDDGVNTRNFSAWLRMRSTLSQCGPVRIQNGGRHFFNSIIEVDGQHNSILDPQIKSSAGSTYGILQKDDSEFLHIYDGEVSGNFLTGSIGIASGDGSKLSGTPAVGHLKMFGTRVTNWDINWRITGSADTPECFGATIANSKTADIVIDSERSGLKWPISALGLFGVYKEDAAFPGTIFLWLKSGQLQGGMMSGCEIGITGTAVMVEPTMDSNAMEFHGNRFPMSGPTDAVTTPGQFSQFYFGVNPTSASNKLGKGTYADKAVAALDPILTGLVVGTKDTGTATNRMTRIFTDIYTANFGDLGPSAILALDFGYTGVPTVTTAQLVASMSAQLGAKAVLGIVFQWWIDANNHIGGSATNVTGSTITAVSGGVRFAITIFG